MKTRRQQRYTILRKAGWLPFEARPLSRVPIRTVPYMKGMIKERQDMFRKAKEMGTTIDRWRSQIKELYIINKFVRTDWKGKKVADPWAFLRDYEDRWRAKNPSYESPWQKRRRSWRRFMEMVEKTIANQRMRSEPA